MRRTRIENTLPALLLLTATMVSQAQTKPGNEPASQPATRPYCIVDTSQAKCYSTQAEITPPKPTQAQPAVLRPGRAIRRQTTQPHAQ